MITVSKADKMFKDLGYDVKEYTSIREYGFKHRTLLYYAKGGLNIVFFLDSKHVEVSKNWEAEPFCVDIHLAIHEKMKELGWIE